MVESTEVGIGLRFTPKGDKPINQLMPVGLETLNKPIKPSKPMYSTREIAEFDTLRAQILFKLSQKQKFRVAIGKSEWIPYEQFDERYNLREILNDEIVIEFDTEDQQIVVPAVGQTCINLSNAGYSFEVWDHGGKSPHIHIHNLPITKMNESQRSTFKKMFIKRYVPIEYQKYMDTSLTGIHLIALEWAFHWKGIYGYKRLIGSYGGLNDTP